MSRQILREYVSLVLREAKIEDVVDSADPVDWIEAAWQDPEEWGTNDPFRAMARAAMEKKLEEVGIGSSRMVFRLNDKVIKLARNEKGLEQNKLEHVAGRDPQVHDILTTVYEHSPEYAWLVSEGVTPLDEYDYRAAETVVGVPWSKVMEFLGMSHRADADSTVDDVTSRTDKTGKKKVGTGQITGEKFLQELGSFLARYSDMLVGDIERTSSWGVNSKGNLVLLDYGITRKKFDQLYRKK